MIRWDRDTPTFIDCPYCRRRNSYEKEAHECWECGFTGRCRTCFDDIEEDSPYATACSERCRDQQREEQRADVKE